MKRRIRLTESDLHNIVKESVSRILNEMHDTEPLDGGKQDTIETDRNTIFDALKDAYDQGVWQGRGRNDVDDTIDYIFRQYF